MADSTRTPRAEGLTAGRPAVVSCWLCGTRQMPDLMVPDGSSACRDIRWYCEDTWACTQRWISTRRQTQGARAAAPGGAVTAPIQAVKPAVPGPTTS
jgi:hypothetical protein